MVILTKIAIFSLLNKIFESGLLQKIVLLKGHVMPLKNVPMKSKLRSNKKRKSENLNILYWSHAVNKASYLEIFCYNALSTCTKVAGLLFLNYTVKKFRNNDKFPNSP
jgi:hypothetical protein